jgi:AcrR family transcriptional regulator
MARATTYTTPTGRATRDAILDAAIQAFAARGYRGASIDSIAAEVGVSRQGVLHHFPSKVKLLVAVLERRDQEDFELAREQFERHGGSLVDMLGAGSRRADRRGLAQLYTILSAESVDPGHPAHDYFVNRYRTVRATFEEWIAGEQAKGTVSDAISPERAASLVVAVLDGLQLQEQLDPDAVDVDGTLSRLLALLMPSAVEPEP